MQLILIGCLLFLTQCATMDVKGRALGEEKQLWIEDLSAKSIAFCHANFQEDGTTKPMCTKAAWSNSLEPKKVPSVKPEGVKPEPLNPAKPETPKQDKT